MEEKIYVYHPDKAEELFYKGCNCSQAVAAAYCDITGMDTDTVLKLSAPFGGGFGRMREVCGTVSGACLVLGALCGYTQGSDREGKIKHYAIIQDFMRRFREKNGSALPELLPGAKEGGVPGERTPDFYKKHMSDACKNVRRDYLTVLNLNTVKQKREYLKS